MSHRGQELPSSGAEFFLLLLLLVQPLLDYYSFAPGLDSA